MAKLWAGDFDVILLVDSMEVTGGFTGGKKGTKDLAMKELKSRGVMPISSIYNIESHWNAFAGSFRD